MAIETWLIDTSAFHKLGSSPDFELWLNRIERGLVFVGAITLLEIGFSARSADDYKAVFGSPLIENLMKVATTSKTESVALDIQHRLALRGHHRAPSMPDLLVAATALTGKHSVLHHDKDFEIIAGITDLSTTPLRMPADV